MKKLVSLLLCLSLCLALGGTALASTAPEDLFRPQAWFGDWADSYELIDWDFYDDANAAGLILSFTSAPASGQQLFEAYAARLEESDLVSEMSRQSFESEYGEYDQEICYAYMGAGNAGSVTSLLGGTVCELALHQVWLADGYPRIVFAWGDGFPMEVYPDGIDAMSADSASAPAPAADSAPVTGPVIPDAWAFFNQEVTHEDEKVENGTSSLFFFDPSHAAAAYEYAALLQNGGFGLTLTDTAGRDWSDGSATRYYFFDCAGQAVAPVDDYVPAVSDFRSAAVILKINDWLDSCTVSIRFSEDLTVTDTGDRCSVTGLADQREALAGPMGGKGSRSGDADYTMAVGESLQLNCPRKFGANTEQFRWAVDEGAGLVSLDGEISASATVTALAPGRVVVSVVYDHSYDTTDVLTGNSTYGFAAPTYYFIINITG